MAMAKAYRSRSHVLLCALSLITTATPFSAKNRLGAVARISSAAVRHAAGDRAAMAHEAARAFDATTLTITPAHQTKAAIMQEWLEGVYDNVDYVAALDAADELPSPFDDGTADDEGTTYGEFPFSFLAALLEELNPPADAYFMDLGSGRGQIALAASQLRPWGGCGGVELLPELHCIAVEAQRVVSSQMVDQNFKTTQPNSQSRVGDSSDASKHPSPTSNCDFSFKVGDMYSTSSIEALTDKDCPLVVFAYATCLEVNTKGELQKLTDALAYVPTGTTVITVNRPLASHPSGCSSGADSPSFVLVRAVKGPNPEINGHEQHSTAFVWRKEV